MDIVTLAVAKSYTDKAISGISGGITYKGAVNYYSSLPSNASVGDAYTVKYKGSSGTDPDGSEYVWGNYEGTNQWIKLGSDSEALTVIYTNNNGTITCNQEWDVIKDAIINHKPIQGWYQNSGSTSVETIYKFSLSNGQVILGYYQITAIGQDVSGYPGYFTEQSIGDYVFQGVRSISIGTTDHHILPSVTTSNNGSILGVTSGEWNKTTLGTIMLPNAQLSGTEPKLTSLTIDSTAYRLEDVLTVVYTKTNDGITCSQEWQTIKDAIENSRPIQGQYYDSSNTIYSITNFRYHASLNRIECYYAIQGSDTVQGYGGYLTQYLISDTLNNGVRSIAGSNNQTPAIPPVTSLDNDRILGVVSGKWNKTTIKTINNQSILGSGNIDIPDNELLIITVDRSNGNSTDVSYADARDAYNAGKTLLLKLTGWGNTNIATLYEVTDSALKFSCSGTATDTELWIFSESGMYYTSFRAVRSVNGKTGGDITLDLQSRDGQIWIDGSASDVWASMALYTVEYDNGGVAFAQLWATIVQALASASDCHLKIANPAAYFLPNLYGLLYIREGQTLGLAVCLDNDNTQILFGTLCGGSMDTSAGTGVVALQFRGPVSNLGTDVVVSAVFTITEDGVIYIDAEKISGYTDLGGKTLSQLTAEVEAAFEALSYSDYVSMEEGQVYTVGGYSWTCTSAVSSNSRSLTGRPEAVQYNIDGSLDTDTETVISVDVIMVG